VRKFIFLLIIAYMLLSHSVSLAGITSCSSFNYTPSYEEQTLQELINEYRQQNGLPDIPLSKSLTYVARTHAQDLQTYPPSGDCNGHSWSQYGEWSACCYTPDHAQASCMWDKPRELTPYVGTGYEIAAWYSNGIDAYTALSLWKSSQGHNDVILNQGIWNNHPWSSIGVGIYDTWAVVWFGEEVDSCGYFGETDWTLTINGPAQVNEDSTAQYSCTANYSDGSSSSCTSSASWGENCGAGSISGSGYLTISSVTSDQSCTITASYSGKSDTHVITIKRASDPVPDIKANGSDWPVTISQSVILSVTGQLNAGSLEGQDADWWVVARTPSPPPDDWYYFDLNLGWLPGFTVTYQGPLFDLPTYEALNTSGLPLGSYTVYFGVDMAMNGLLDMDQAYYDSVDVIIDPYFQANLFNVEQNHFYHDVYASVVKWLGNYLEIQLNTENE